MTNFAKRALAEREHEWAARAEVRRRLENPTAAEIAETEAGAEELRRAIEEDRKEL